MHEGVVTRTPRAHIPAIGILLLAGGCAKSPSAVGRDGEAALDAADPDARTLCGARSPASIWATWKMPNPRIDDLPNPASYTDLGDGTVRDNVTCLVWQREVPEDTYSWDEAKDYCGSLPLAGGGWRLPTRIELISLVDFTKVPPEPTIDTTAFPNTPPEVFWSSSPTAGAPFVWFVYFSGGATSNYEPFARSRVRCVR